MNLMRACKYLLLLAWSVTNDAAVAQPPDRAPAPAWVREGFPLTLRVLKADGTPLRKGHVSIVNLSGQSATSTARIKRSDTDEDGVYSPLWVHKSGQYSLYVRAPGHGIAIVPVLDLEADNPQRVEVRLGPEGSLRATARAAGDGAHLEKGGGLGGARLFLMPVDADELVGEGDRGNPTSLNWLLPVDEVNRVTRDGDGALEMSGLRPGAYFATLLLPGHRAAGGRAVETITIEAGKTTELALSLEPTVGAPLRLLILDAAGEPQANREVQVVLQPEPEPGQAPEPLASRVATANLANMQHFLGGTPGYFGYTQRRALTDKEGRLTLHPIPLGRWQVSLLGHVMQPVVAQVATTGGEATLRPGKDEAAPDRLSPAAIVEPK